MATRFLEVRLSGVGPDAFDAAAFYKSQLQATRTVQVARVEKGMKGGTKILLSGDARECTQLFIKYQSKTRFIHQGSQVQMWAPNAPLHQAPVSKQKQKPTMPSFSRTKRATAKAPRSHGGDY